MALKYAQTNTLYQSGSGNIIGATSIVLTSLTDIYGNVLTMTDFGAKGYGTAEPDTTNEEAFTFTGIVANANGTYTLTGVSTSLGKSPYTETSGLIRQHSGGTKVVITDNVAFWNTFGQTANTNTWADVQTFSVPAVQATNPTGSTQVANKAYVDGVAVAGAPNASTTVKGIVQEATQAQVLAKTAAGSTGADLYVNPSTLSDTLLSDYKVDTGAANAYAIAPSPAITAYTVGQIFSFKAVNANTTVSTLNVNALGVKTIKKAGGATDLVSGDIAAGMIVVVEYDGTNFIMLNPVANAPLSSTNLKFGGTGTDGALAVSSGNTNIDCANAAYVEKNYTSVSITGTGSVTFINPHANGTFVVIKSQAGWTLTSSTAPMLSVAGMGSGGATGHTCTSGGGGGGPTTASNGNAFYLFQTNGGVSGTWNTGTEIVGPGGALPTAIAPASSPSFALMKYGGQMWVGAGGGGGGCNTNNSSVGGNGGNGGGGLLIECGGAWNFTTASGISAAGANGTNATGAGAGRGGGGGGAGGYVRVIYATLTANSGTINVAGGAGGTGSGESTGGGSGATAYTVGAAGSGSTGGTGPTGISVVESNANYI